MKKLVEAVLYDKTGKMLFAYVFKTSTIKTFAGIKRIAELEDDVYAQVELESHIIDAAKRLAKDNIEVDHILIYNDYADTVNKYTL